MARIPIVAMTAHAMDEHRRQCLDAGMDDFVSKPFHSDLLAKVIERRLSAIPWRPPARNPGTARAEEDPDRDGPEMVAHEDGRLGS
jgi:DNA-binding response OmpR family regulator